MYGVILWSDPDVQKAVIWCEDQGDLAYYEANDASSIAEDVFFDAGDYVEFDVTVENDLRRASNAQTILAARYPTVAHTLDRVVPTPPRSPMQSDAATSAQVIQFSDHLRGHQSPHAEISRRG